MIFQPGSQFSADSCWKWWWKMILATNGIILRYISRANQICGVIWRRLIKEAWWERHVEYEVIQFGCWTGWFTVDWQENWISRLPIRRAGVRSVYCAAAAMLIMIAGSFTTHGGFKSANTEHVYTHTRTRCMLTYSFTDTLGECRSSSFLYVTSDM